MADLLGNITVPEPSVSGIFPLIPDYPYSKRTEPVVVTHSFLSGNGKIEQRFKLGVGATVWTLTFNYAGQTDADALEDFFNARKGPYQPFLFNEPTDDGTDVVVRRAVFADAPLTIETLRDMCYRTGVTLLEYPTEFPTYEIGSTVDRFPAGTLEAALTGQVQELIPQIEIYPLDGSYPVIRISDRKCHFGDDLYHARLVTHSGIGQEAGGASDYVRFTFGNADRVMTLLSNDVDLFLARVQVSLYHVQTETRIELWQGEVMSYAKASDTEFQIECVDGCYALTLQYPVRRLTSMCGKQYDSADSGCPWTSESGSLDLVHFPSAVTTSCDHGYATANGCLAHQMKRYYGGLQLDPQQVVVKNNTTGFFGLGRLSMTAVSQVGDSAIGQPLTKIITDIPIPVPCQMLAGRDEGDFYEAVGIVGEGPIVFGRGTYDSAGNRQFHKLDGQPNHGDPGSLGLREITGTDPAGATDFMSLDQSGNQTAGDWRKVYSGSSTYLDNFAAGVAAVVVRRADEKGFQLTTLDQHELTAIVATGLYGPAWTAPGARVSRNLTNPIWLCCTAWLEYKGLLRADTAAQESVIDVPSAIACAAICDATVPKLIGEGTEVQFAFYGMIRDIKSLKDWLSEILKNCLGGFVISNGKLKFFIRQDSAAEAQFSIGNIIHGSLQLGPIQPTFNRLLVNFGNTDYGMVEDGVPVQDIDNIALKRRVEDGYLNLAGAGTKSRAGRIGTVHLREELGGINATEWRKARQGSFRSTVLALSMEVGKGLGITHEDVPDGYGVYRLHKWVLYPDMSMDFAFRVTTDSMYDLVTGPKAVDSPANSVPVEFFPFPLRSAWFPNEIAPQAEDALFDEYDRTFTVSVVYQETADSGRQAFIVCGGRLAVNSFKSDTIPPVIASQSQSESGGTVNGGRNYFAQVFVRDDDGHWSPGSNIRRFTFEETATNTNQLTVGDITWPPGTWAEACLFVGDDERLICFQHAVAETSGLPEFMSLTTPLREATFNAPSPAHRNIVAKIKPQVHGGVVSTTITAVDTSGGVITMAGLAGMGDDWTGRLLYLSAKFDNSSAAPATFLIASFDPYTGDMELTPEPAPGQLDVGDLMYIRCIPTTFSGVEIGDEKFISGVYPDGLVIDGEIGLFVRGVTPGRPHQVRRIVANTQTVYTVDRAFDFEPAYFCVEGPAWAYEGASTPVEVPDIDTAVSAAVPVTNFLNQPITVAVFLVDRQGGETPDELCLVRDTFVFGEQGELANLTGKIRYA